MSIDRRKVLSIVIAILFIALAIVSVTFLAKTASSTDYHAERIKYLESKKSTVMTLTAVSVTASTAITLTPGDAGTPIADKLADLSEYFLLALVAINLEEYLLTITGYTAFKFLIPAACALLILFIFWPRKNLAKLAAKLALFGICIFCLVPTSIAISQMIEDTYALTIETDEYGEIDLNEIAESESASEKTEQPSGFFGTITQWATGVVDTVTGAATDTLEKMEQILNDLIEKLAVILVTSCLIPILVLFFFFWITKSVLGMEVDFGRGMKLLPPPIPMKSVASVPPADEFSDDLK